MGRKRTKEKKLIESGTELFLRYGVKRVTVEEICNHAETSKMTFYKYFTNKNDILKRVLEKLITENRKQFTSIMESDLPFNKKIEKTILMKIEQAGNVSNEFTEDLFKHADSEVKNFMQQNLDDSFQLIRKFYGEAQHRGDIRKDIKLDFIFFMLKELIELSSNRTLLTMYKSQRELTYELLTFFFYGILKRPDLENEN